MSPVKHVAKVKFRKWESMKGATWEIVSLANERCKALVCVSSEKEINF